EGSEQVREPVIFSCCVPPYLIITRVKNRDPSVAILCHRVSLSMNSMSCPNYVYRFIFSAFEASFDVKPMSVKLSPSRRKIRLAFTYPWRPKPTKAPNTKTHRERFLHPGKKKKSPPQHTENKTRNHSLTHANAQYYKCKNSRNKNQNRRKIGKSM